MCMKQLKPQFIMDFYICIVLLCLIQTSDQLLDYHEIHNTAHISRRLIQMMRTYYEDTSKRIEELNLKKIMYEESPQFETGYVFGELIERYRKMVEHVQRPIEFPSDSVFETLKRTELIQKLYFDIYHTVNMLHEVPQKYKNQLEFADSTKDINREALDAAQSKLEASERRREKARKKMLKSMKKYRELYMKGLVVQQTRTKRPRNKWWPIDYGWEIDYYW